MKNYHDVAMLLTVAHREVMRVPVEVASAPDDDRGFQVHVTREAAETLFDCLMNYLGGDA